VQQHLRLLEHLISARGDVRALGGVILIPESGFGAGVVLDPHLRARFLQQIDRARNHGHPAFRGENFFENTNDKCQLD
jgi:hypothetical protein